MPRSDRLLISGAALSALYRLDLASRDIERLYAHQVVDVDDLVTDLAGENVIGVQILHGYRTRPSAADEPHPLVLLPHGGPYGVRDRWGFDWEVQLLASDPELAGGRE